jgi:phage baseplate assembly protein W
MPINIAPISVNPIDLNKNVAVGVVFPLMNGGVFQQSLTIKEQVKSNIINVLLTQRGERVLQPDFGAGLKNILFENNPNPDEIQDLIFSQLQTYVPEIIMDRVEVQTDIDRHIIFVTLVYSFLLDNTQDSIQININQQQQSPGMNG